MFRRERGQPLQEAAEQTDVQPNPESVPQFPERQSWPPVPTELTGNERAWWPAWRGSP